jgi:PAS domain S-box-containing protein
MNKHTFFVSWCLAILSGLVRVKEEQMVQESESNFRALVENAHDGIVVLSSDGQAAYANDRACEITGYSQDELSTADFGAKAHREDFSIAVQRFQEIIADEQAMGCLETKLLHKRGEMRWVELSASKTVWNRQPAVLVIFRDITERKCTQETLLNSCAELKCRVENRDLELKKTVRALESKRRELSLLKIEGEKISNELLETNNAISILARNMNDHRLEAEKSIAGTINSKIMPIVENLRKQAKPDDLKIGLDILDAHLQTLAKELMGEMNTLAKLTPSEMQVATMIKNGLKSREIAERFYISLQTVKTHRRNIRKKLNIHAPGASLTSYLRSIME